MRQLTREFLIVVAGLGVAACGGTVASNAPASSAPSSAASAPAGSAAAACAPMEGTGDAQVTVDIKDFAFNPDPVKAKVGDVVTWTNSDSATHTASLVDDSCTTPQLATGITGALVFNVAGSYPYQCNIHPSQMKGTIEVQ